MYLPCCIIQQIRVLNNRHWRNAKEERQMQRAAMGVGRKELRGLMFSKWWTKPNINFLQITGNSEHRQTPLCRADTCRACHYAVVPHGAAPLTSRRGIEGKAHAACSPREATSHIPLPTAAGCLTLTSGCALLGVECQHMQSAPKLLSGEPYKILHQNTARRGRRKQKIGVDTSFI